VVRIGSVLPGSIDWRLSGRKSSAQAGDAEPRMALFLSDAAEDQEAAVEIATWFDQHGIDIYYWNDLLLERS
jgi:hypothetical protein